MKPIKLQAAVNLALIVLLPLLMAYSLVGEAIHEWLGVVMGALFILHHILNRGWYKGLCRGRHTIARTLGTVTDLLLLADMIVLTVSGIVMSRHLFTFLRISGGMSLARITHLLASYWGLALMSFHAGLHGEAIMGSIRRLARIKGTSALRTAIPRSAAVLLGLWGVLSFIRREIGSYLFLRNQFVFFDFSQPLALFFDGLYRRDVSFCRVWVLRCQMA